MNGGIELAEDCHKRVNGTKDMEITQNMDLIASLSIVQKMGPDVEFYTEAMVAKMQKTLEILEKCLQMAIRADDGELIQDTCVLAWNTGLPLLQPNLRKLVKTIMYIAAEALENIKSPLTELRTLLHLEMARCELADELIQKADTHSVKALSLDYYVEEEESGKYDLLRPLDRFLVPIKERLDLKLSIYAQPDRPEEKAMLIVDQARSSKDQNVVQNMLDRASMMVLDSEKTDPNEPAPEETGTLPPGHRERFLLWADIAKIAWKARVTKTARVAAERVMSADLVDLIKDRDLFIARAETAFIQGETFALEKKESEQSGDILTTDTFDQNADKFGYDGWQDFQVEEEQWDVNTGKPGHLQVRPSTGRDMGSIKDTTHRFFQETGWALFDMSTHVELNPADGSNLIGGLSVASYADRDWMGLKLGCDTHSDRENMAGKACLAWEHKGHIVAEMEAPSTNLHLRILKNYDQYSAWWKAAAGDEWEQLGEEITASYSTPFEAGLFAGNASDLGAGSADFEFFDVVTRDEMATRRMMEGLRLGVKISEAWIVRNAAIYVWNYNLSLVKASRAHLFAGHLEEMFEILFEDEGKFAKQNLPTATNITLALAQAKEQQYALSKGGKDTAEGVIFGSGAFPTGLCDSSEPKYIRGLRELFGKGNSSPELTKIIEVCTKCASFLTTPARMQGILEVMTRAKMLLAQDVSKMSEEFAEGYLRSIVLVEELQYELNEAQSTELVTKAMEQIAIAEKAPEPDPEKPNAEVEAVRPNAQLWVNISRCAFMTGQFKKAEECSLNALGATDTPEPLVEAKLAQSELSQFAPAKQRNAARKKVEEATSLMHRVAHDPVTSREWRWFSLAESFMAQSILAQIQPERQDFGIQNRFRRMALDHFAKSTKYGKAIKSQDLVLNAARLAWNAALPNVGSEITRRALMDPLQAIVESLWEVEPTSIEVMERQPGLDMEVKVNLYRLLLKCYEDKEEFDAGIPMCEKAIAKSLPAYQKTLWEAKMVMMSKVGRNVAGELSRLKEANPVLQARLLSKLARSAKLPSEQINSIQKILSLLASDPLEQFDYYIQLAECLFANSCASKDIQDQLMTAMDIMVDLDPTVDPDEDANPYGALGEGSQTSGSVRSSQKPKTESVVSASQKSGSGAYSSARSKRPSARGSSQAGSSSKGKEAEAESPEEKLSVTTLLKAGRVCAMLGMVAPTIRDQVGCCLMARHYWQQIFKMHFTTLLDNATNEEKEEFEANLAALPSTKSVTSWLEYPVGLIDTMVKQASERAGPGGKQTLAVDTLDDGNLSLVYIRFAADVLMSQGHLAQALPLTALAEVVGAGAMKCISVKPLERLRAARILDELGSLYAFKATAPSLEELKIDSTLLGERRIEMQRRVQVKKTAAEEAEESKQGKENKKFTLKGATRMVQSVQSMGGSVVKEKTKKRLMQPLSDREMWVQTAYAALERGEFKAAKELATEAKNHADAFDDEDTKMLADFCLATLAWAEGDLALAKEMANQVRAHYTEIQLWADATLLVAEIEIHEEELSMAADTLTKAITLTEALIPPEVQPGEPFGACPLLTIVPKTLIKFNMAMAKLKGRAMNLDGRNGPIEVGQEELEETLGYLEKSIDLAEGAADPRAVMSLSLERAELLLALPMKVDGPAYNTMDVLSELLVQLELQRVSCQNLLHELTLANTDTRAGLTVSNTLSRIESSIARCYMGLSYSEEQAKYAWLQSMTVVDRYLEDPPDPKVVPKIDRAVFHATAACSLEATLEQKSYAKLILGLAIAGADKSKLMAKLEDCKIKAEHTGRELNRAANALEVLEEAAAEAGKKTKKKKKKEEILLEKQEARKQKIAIKEAQEVVATKQKASAYDAEQYLAARERCDPWISPTYVCPEDGTPHEFPEGALSVAVDCMGKPLLSSQGLKAIECFEEALVSSREVENYDIAYEAALSLANIHGRMGGDKASKALFLAQSFKFRAKAGTLFSGMSNLNNRERLFMMRRERVKSLHNDPSLVERFNKDTAFLNEKSVTWQRLSTSNTVEEMQEALPANMKTLMLHVEMEPRPFVFASVLDNASMDVMRFNEEESDAVLSYVKDSNQTEYEMRLHLMRTAGKTPAPNLTTRIWRLEQRRAEVFSPLTTLFEEALTDKEKYLVLLPDEIFAGLSLDKIPRLYKGLKSCSIDFSLHMLHHRLKASLPENIELSSMQYVVDSKKESDQQAPFLSSFASEVNDPTVSGCIIKWEGKTGEDHAVTQGEWQQNIATAAAKSANLLYYGFGKPLSYLEPGSLLGIDLSPIGAAMLLAGVENDKAYQVSVKMDNTKTVARILAESPYRTAALISLRGVSTVVINRQMESQENNRKIMKGLIVGASTGGCIGDVLKKAIEPEKGTDFWLQIDDPPEPEESQPATGRTQASGAKSTARSKGNAKGKPVKEEPAPETQRSLEPVEPPPEVIPERFLTTSIYGLPHLATKVDLSKLK